MNWGVPDWRDQSAYPGPESITLRQWWWQFTRRHPDFRELWIKYASRQAAMINSNMEHCAAMAQSQGSSLYEYLQWKLDQAPTNDPVMMRQRFKMSVLINPTKDFSDDHLRHFLYHDGAWGVSYYDLDAMKRDEDQGRTLVSFNLHKSLEEQLRFARSYLEDLQDDLKGEAVIRRPRKSNWPLFLRAIDARDVDATFDEMAKAFWPGQEKTPQSARDAYLAACQLREKFPI